MGLYLGIDRYAATTSLGSIRNTSVMKDRPKAVRICDPKAFSDDILDGPCDPMLEAGTMTPQLWGIPQTIQEKIWLCKHSLLARFLACFGITRVRFTLAFAGLWLFRLLILLGLVRVGFSEKLLVIPSGISVYEGSFVAVIHSTTKTIS